MAVQTVAELPPHVEFLSSPYSGLEGARVVLVGVYGEMEPGVEVTWWQGDHHGARREFGLVMPVRGLIEQCGPDVDDIGFYIALAVDEPHGGPTDGTRVWLTRLPTALME